MKRVRDVETFIVLPMIDLGDIQMHPGSILCDYKSYRSIILYTDNEGFLLHIEPLFGEEYNTRQKAYYWAKRHIELTKQKSAQCTQAINKITSSTLRGNKLWRKPVVVPS